VERNDGSAGLQVCDCGIMRRQRIFHQSGSVPRRFRQSASRGGFPDQPLARARLWCGLAATLRPHQADGLNRSLIQEQGAKNGRARYVSTSAKNSST